MHNESKIVILGDSFNTTLKEEVNIKSVNDKDKSRMKGFVEIFIKENDKLTKHGKSNLIVYEGREVVLQRMLNKNRDNNVSLKDSFISWLSIGNGGASSSDPLTPLYPALDDTGLGGDGSTELVIDAANPNYYDGGKKKPFDTVEFIQDDANDNRYLIAKITTTILRDEANTNNVNEAALWLSNSTDPNNVDANLVKLFSRVCFSTIEKNPNREIVLVWYLFF